MAPKKKVCAECGKNRLIKQYVSINGRICKPCQRAKQQARSRKQHLEETYGLTLEEYDALLAAQGGKCAICKGTRTYNLQVDHCHKTGFTRGLLCKGCNKRLLPAARDDVNRLKSAILYLMEPPAHAVIGERVAPVHRE